MKKNDLLFYVFIFFTTFLVLQYFSGSGKSNPILDEGEIGMEMSKDSYAIGKNIALEIQNNTEKEIILETECPDAPLDIYRFTSAGYELVVNAENRDCSNSQNIILTPGKKQTISYTDYSYSIFGETGKYKIELTTEINAEQKTFSTPDFEIKNPGIFTNGWRTIIYQPMLNLLVAILTYMPGHNLGLGIIVLTLIIRTILLIPSQKGMLAQRKMQELQPRLEEIKKRYAGDQARLAQETMLLWKTNKVHPLSSCFPLLIQIPVLIGLYYVVQNGLQPDRSGFIYDFLPEFSLQKINQYFLSFNLLEKSLFLFPIMVGGLQFLQMKLMMAKQKKNQQGAAKPSELEMANKMMVYFMPIMIAVFTASLPAAVGLYWGTSTTYGILQQLVVNRTAKIPLSGDDDVQVRIIKK